MTKTPTGRVIATALGPDLVLTRSFRADIDDVWASITEPERTGRWFGTWTGDAAPGNTIMVTMTFEDEGPAIGMRIDKCEPPRLLAVSAEDEYGSWRLEARLTTDSEGTLLTFTQHVDDLDSVSGTGPGWEYYLDNLVASIAGSPAPSFDDYYPELKEYYAQAADACR
ncbi:SRPBCC family protein [Lolliginicoccus suaedae]|uniref:SRPBCC family protein n=1 Tax=Lolliginicoccus suaedae TaxID=2605429 RepID=UPI0011EC1B72|nr:SRPBCC family protein [Lolliginicoccus suaedae]